MNTLDIIFLGLIGASVVYSLIRGLIREIFSFLSIIVGFFTASYGSPMITMGLVRWIQNETLAQIVGFAFLFVLAALCVSLIGKLLSRWMKKMDLGWADRIAGAAFGFLKAILLVAIILLVLTAFFPPKSRILSESQVSPIVLNIARGLSFLVPEDLRILYSQKEKELVKYWASQVLTEGKHEITGGKR
jgi:membrane protein required for colicin V production